MRKASPYALLVLLASGAFTLATVLQPRATAWQKGEKSGGNFLQAFLGDGRRLFANHFFIKADVSFHGGYYPSIFDRTPGTKDRRHLTEKEENGQAQPEPGPADSHAGHAHDEHGACEKESQHEKDMAFLGPPRDWIERFGRRFMITQHAHLQGGTEREILPWLRISAELDPDKPDTYTVAAYWLRDMGRIKEAEAFLREGLRNIPDSYELYFELGKIYLKNHKDSERAKNLWELGLTKWNAADVAGKKPDLFQLGQIAVHLSRLEEDRGNLVRAAQLLRIAVKATPNPENLQAQIKELELKIAQAPKPLPQ